MATVSQAVLDKINAAETDLQAAKDADAQTAAAKQTADAAIAAEDAAKNNAATLHTTANTSALDALAALKAELGIPA